MINVIKSTFSGTGHEGDFSWMITQPHHARTLFLFNDNEGEFYAHLNEGPHQCSAGAGNAVIRPYQCIPEPRATGLPTGTYAPGPHFKGYSSLDDQVTLAILDSMCQINMLLTTGRFDSLAFSWDDKTKLGGHTFNPSQVVRDYMINQIYSVVECS